MERGTRKSETGAEHLERTDYILSEQKKQSAKLDAEIAEKRDRLNSENGNAIKSGMANLLGKGKYADMEKENKRLKEELPKQKAAIQRKYQQALEVERDRQSWKSRARLTPEGKAALTPENLLFLTPLKS